MKHIKLFEEFLNENLSSYNKEYIKKRCLEKIDIIISLLKQSGLKEEITKESVIKEIKLEDFDIYGKLTTLGLFGTCYLYIVSKDEFDEYEFEYEASKKIGEDEYIVVVLV